MALQDAIHPGARQGLARLDPVWVAVVAIPILLGILVPGQLWPTMTFVAGSLASTAIYIVLAVLMIGWLMAARAEGLISRSLQERKLALVILAALAGSVSPLCSCEVIPVIAAMIAAGAPMSAAMAFMLSSPITDPPMFLITISALGLEFAIGKTIAAVAIGLFGGFAMVALERIIPMQSPASPDSCNSSCSDSPLGTFDWRFWRTAERVKVFKSEVLRNTMFLMKWLLLAYTLESLMLAWVPASWISSTLGGDGLWPVVLGTLLGIPAYLNGYAALPLVSGMIEQGMAQGTAMAFLVAGGITCIPAAMAAWAVLGSTAFASYIAFAISGSILVGLAWGIVASFIGL